MLQIPRVDSFHYCRKKWDNLAWCASTYLRNDSINQCLYLLFHCPNLIEFHCLISAVNIHTIFPPEVIFSPSRTPKICLNLRIFHWGGLNEDWNRFLFSSIRFPNLKTWRVSSARLRPLWSTEHIDSVSTESIDKTYRQHIGKRIHTIAEPYYCS